MLWGRIVAIIRLTTLVAASSLCHATCAQSTPDADKPLQDADCLAWVQQSDSCRNVLRTQNGSSQSVSTSSDVW
jgi:hypothetical protein